MNNIGKYLIIAIVLLSSLVIAASAVVLIGRLWNRHNLLPAKPSMPVSASGVGGGSLKQLNSTSSAKLSSYKRTITEVKVTQLTNQEVSFKTTDGEIIKISLDKLPGDLKAQNLTAGNKLMLVIAPIS